MVAYFGVLTSRSQKKRVVSVDAAVMLIALVGFSRVYLDAHYISDLVGGGCGGASTARGTEMLMPIWLRLFGALQKPIFNFKVVR